MKNLEILPEHFGKFAQLFRENLAQNIAKLSNMHLLWSGAPRSWRL